MQQLLAKCWADEGFKNKMLADPAATMKAEGVEPPAGVTIKVVENTDKVMYLTLPVRPTDLSDDDLEKVAGGGVVGDVKEVIGVYNDNKVVINKTLNDIGNVFKSF